MWQKFWIRISKTFFPDFQLHRRDPTPSKNDPFSFDLLALPNLQNIATSPASTLASKLVVEPTYVAILPNRWLAVAPYQFMGESISIDNLIDVRVLFSMIICANIYGRWISQMFFNTIFQRKSWEIFEEQKMLNVDKKWSKKK